MTGLNDRMRRLVRMIDTRVLAGSLSFYETTVAAELSGDWASLLDIGCGVSPVIERASSSIPSRVGIDAYAGTIEDRLCNGAFDRYEQVEALDAVGHFGEESFDVVTAMDVIEHLPKEDGFRLLEVMERLARHRVVVFTPNGFLPQGAVDGNPLQVHRSGWTTDEFEHRGYRVIGVNGWRPLRGECWHPRIRPASLGHRLSAATQPLVTNRPRAAFQLLAVRDLSAEARRTWACRRSSLGTT